MCRAPRWWTARKRFEINPLLHRHLVGLKKAIQQCIDLLSDGNNSNGDHASEKCKLDHITNSIRQGKHYCCRQMEIRMLAFYRNIYISPRSILKVNVKSSNSGYKYIS